MLPAGVIARRFMVHPTLFGVGVAYSLVAIFSFYISDTYGAWFALLVPPMQVLAYVFAMRWVKLKRRGRELIVSPRFGFLTNWSVIHAAFMVDGFRSGAIVRPVANPFSDADEGWSYILVEDSLDAANLELSGCAVRVDVIEERCYAAPADFRALGAKG